MPYPMYYTKDKDEYSGPDQDDDIEMNIECHCGHSIHVFLTEEDLKQMLKLIQEKKNK